MLSRAITSMPSASAASGAVLGRHDCASAPPRRAASAIASAPETGRVEPSSASSPTIASRGSASQRAARRRSAAPRRSPGPSRARLAQAGGREVGDDPPQRELEVAVDQRRAHPLPRLPAPPRRGGRRSRRREAAVDVDLDPDRRASRRCAMCQACTCRWPWRARLGTRKQPDLPCSRARSRQFSCTTWRAIGARRLA